MKRFIIILLCLCVFGLITGCKSDPMKNPDTNPDIRSLVDNNKEVEKNLDETKDTVDKKTKNIDVETKEIDQNIKIIEDKSTNLEENFNELQEIVPELMALSDGNQEVIDLIYRSINTIKNSAQAIDESNKSIIESNEAIKVEKQDILNAIKDIQNNNEKAKRIQVEINQKDKVIDQQEKKIDELKDTAEAASTKYLGVIIAFGAVIMVLGVLGFFYNFKIGIAMLGIGGITVSITASIIYYMGWFALIGLIVAGVGLSLLIAYIAWIIIKGRTFAKATEENAELIETIKQELPEDKIHEIFGDRIKPGVAQALQSKSTQKEIDKIRRKKIKPKMENTLGTTKNGELFVKNGIVYQRVAESKKLNK